MQDIGTPVVVRGHGFTGGLKLQHQEPSAQVDLKKIGAGVTKTGAGKLAGGQNQRRFRKPAVHLIDELSAHFMQGKGAGRA